MNAAYKKARKQIGLRELKDGHNSEIVQFFADVGHSWVKDDETAWCAAFVGSMLKRAGFDHTGKLNARSYLDWGEPVALEDAREGDVVVFWRGSKGSWKGHVGFFVKQDGSDIIVLGGNQSNEVNEQSYPAARLLGVRRAPEWREAKGVLAFILKFLKGMKK